MDRYWARLDDEGRASAFYAASLHGEGPPGTVEITEATWRAWVADTDRQRWDGAQLVPCAPPTRPDLTAAEARARRDALLAASDWTQLPDAPLATAARAAWSDYRTALRAVPQQPGFPATIAWPVAPG